MDLSKILSICFTTVFLTTITTSASADSSVWKVSKGDDYIYLAGTVHILPTSEFPLPKEFDLAYKDSDHIVLEAQLPDPTDQKAQMEMIQSMAYKNGQKLSDVISKENFKKLSDYLATVGINLAELNGFKPGFIVSMMAIMEAQKAQIAGEGVDAYFAKQAKLDGKTAEYLETMEFQLNLLANIGTGHENELIQSSLAQMDDFKALLEKLIVAWRLGDTEQLNDIVITPMIAEDPKSYQTMFTARNQNWIPLIEQMFTDNNKELVLVGVGHLIGKDSVIAMLKRKGFTITKISLP